ncbi:glyoxalase [Lachnotalea glycerini]|uniref:Glyoxalase n=1 Tax=Lachnotalea glycerini TaxID=1763509 RepID=A0A371JKE9_9FIRM|nr:glyoxalase [Lachnotalea glycerini]RDY33190.1 glyoxalase [Lachnotalea glycerini]
MYHYDEECLKTFLEKQKQIYKENVAETLEEADEFLEDCMAIVVNSQKEIKAYFDEVGVDVQGMSLNDIENCDEVIKLPSGRYLVVEV